MPSMRLTGIALMVASLVACQDTTSPVPSAAVHFALDAPLCSSVLPVQFSIDGVVVGTDTFRVNLAPNHTTSAAFSVAAGIHTLGALVMGGYVWPDTVVSVAAGSAFTRVLPFYCS